MNRPFHKRLRNNLDSYICWFLCKKDPIFEFLVENYIYTEKIMFIQQSDKLLSSIKE